MERKNSLERSASQYGMRRQSAAATALWLRRRKFNCCGRLVPLSQSGVALRLPPQSKASVEAADSPLRNPDQRAFGDAFEQRHQVGGRQVNAPYGHWPAQGGFVPEAVDVNAAPE